MLQISRCQRTEDGNINIGGDMKAGERSEPFNSYMREVEGSIVALLEQLFDHILPERTGRTQEGLFTAPVRWMGAVTTPHFESPLLRFRLLLR